MNGKITDGKDIEELAEKLICRYNIPIEDNEKDKFTNELLKIFIAGIDLGKSVKTK